MSVKKKASAAVSLLLALVLVVTQSNLMVFAADNEVFNAPTVQNGDVLELADTALLGLPLPKDIGKSKSFDLVLDGAEWNLPSNTGTLQDLYGSDAVYKQAVNHDSKAVPFAKDSGVITFSGKDKSGEEYPDVVWMDANGNLVSNDGTKVNTNSYYDTNYGTIMSRMSAASSMNILNISGLVGSVESGFDLISDSEGIIEYSVDFSAIKSGITWTSESPSVVTVVGDDSDRYIATFTKVSNGSAKITAKAKDLQGTTITLAEFNVRTGDMSGSPSITLTPISPGATFNSTNFTLSMDSDTTEAKFTLTASNISDSVVLETDNPYLEIIKTNDIVTLKKPLNLTHHEYATISVKTNGIEFATIMVLMKANKHLEIEDIIVSGTDLGRYGTTGILATYNGSNTPSGSVVIKTVDGLNAGDRIVWTKAAVGSAGAAAVDIQASSLITANNQVTLNISSITGTTTPKTFSIKGSNESGDEVLQLYLYITDDNSDLELSITRPMLSAIQESTNESHDYVLPAGSDTGTLKVSVNMGGKAPNDYDWSVSDSDAASVTVNASGTLLLTKNQYLTASVPITVKASDTGVLISSFTILLEVESGSQSISISKVAGAITETSDPKTWKVSKDMTTATMLATFTGITASSTTWVSDTPSVLSVQRSGSTITLKLLSVPAKTTTVKIQVNGGTETFTFLVEGETSEGSLGVAIPVGSSITYETETSTYVLPESTASGNLAITKTDISDSSSISWTVSDSTFVTAVANSSNTLLKISRIGNNGSPNTVTVTGYVDGVAVLTFLLRDMGGTNIDEGSTGSVELEAGEGINFDEATNTYTLPSYNGYGLINLNLTGFGVTDTVSFNTSRSDVFGVSVNPAGTHLRLTRKIAHPTEDVTAQLNVMVNGVTQKTVTIKSIKSSTTGTVSPSFIALPSDGVTTLNGVWTSDSTQESATFVINPMNTTVESIMWSTAANGVTITKEENKIKINKASNMASEVSAEIIAKVGGVAIGSFYINLYPYRGGEARQITLLPEQNFMAGSSVDYVMEQDAEMGTFLVDYNNFNSGELEWSSSNPGVMSVKKTATGLVVSRLVTLKSMTLITLTVSSAYGKVESYDLLIPATDKAVGTNYLQVKVGSGLTKDEASGKMIVSAQNPTFKISDGNSAFVEGATLTCSTNMITLVDNKGTVTVTIPDGFDGEFSVTVEKDGFNPATQIFVVQRIASSEIYVEVVSGANVNVANGKYLMTGTTSVFSVTDYNYNFLGQLLAACNDKYIAIDVNEDIVTVTSPDGYNKEIVILFQADGFEDSYITLIPKSVTEAGINLKQTDTVVSGWSRTGTRSWNFTGDGENTTFMAFLNPAAYATAKIYQINEAGIKSLVPSTTEAGGVSFKVKVPNDLTSEVEHTLEVQMKDMTRTFTLVFESTGEIVEPPDEDVLIELEASSSRVNKITEEEFSVVEGVTFTYVTVKRTPVSAMFPSVDWQSDDDSVSVYTLGAMIVFDVDKVLEQDVTGVLTVSYPDEESRSFTFTFKGTETSESGIFSVTSYTGVQSFINNKYVLNPTASKATFTLAQEDATVNSLYWVSSSAAAAPDLSTTFVNGTAVLNVNVGLVTADTSVTLDAYTTSSVGAASYAGSINIVVPQNTGAVGNASGALSDFVYKVIDKTTLHVTIPNGYKIENGNMLYIPMLTKIKSSDGASVQVKASSGGTGIKSGTYLFAMSSKMGTKTTIDSVRNFKKDVILADIRIMEKAANVITEGTLTLKLDEDFVFVEGSEQNFLEGALANHFTISGMTVKDSKATIEFKAKDTTLSREGKTGAIVLSGLEIKKAKGADSNGKVEMRISGVGMTSARLDVANCTGSDLALTIDDEDEDMPVIMAGQIFEDFTDEDTMTLDFTVAGKLEEAKKLGIDVPEGIIVRAIEINDAYGVEGIEKGDIVYHEDNEDADDGYPILIDDELIDLRDVVISDDEGASISMKAFITISPDYMEDEVIFTLTNGSSEDCVVASVTRPVTANTSSTILADKLLKDTVYSFKDIELKETDKASLVKPDETVDTIYEPKFSDDLYVAHNVVIGIEGFDITSIDGISIAEGDIQINDYKLDRGVISFDVKKASRKASTIKITGVKGKPSLTQLPAGGVSLYVGGSSIAANYYEGKTRDVINTFTVPYFTTKGYVVSDSKDAIGYKDPTKDASGRTIAAALQIGSNEIIKSDGTIIVMDTVPEIKDGRTMLPIRFVAEAIGINSGNIIWDEATRTVVIVSDGTFCQLRIGDNFMYRSNSDGTVQTIQMDVAPYIKDDRTMLPIRFIAEALRLRVEWDAETQSVLIIQIAANDSEIGVVGPSGMSISDSTDADGRLPSLPYNPQNSPSTTDAWSQFQKMLESLVQSK